MIQKPTKYVYAIHTVMRCARSAFLIGVVVAVFVTLQVAQQYYGKWPHGGSSTSQLVDSGVDFNTLGPALNRTFKLSELFQTTVINRTAVARKLLAEHGMSSSSQSDGVVKRVLIVTTWRSGSTFTGELLRAIPGTFYNYEPLIHLPSDLDVPRDAKATVVMDDLKKILQCDYLGLKEAFSVRKTSLGRLLHFNEAFANICKETDIHGCYEKDAWSFGCRHFPIQVAKVVRVPLRYTLPLLRDPNLNLNVVLLVRDPRAVMASRLRARSWCRGSCANRGRLCDLMRDNYETALQAAKEFPDTFTVLRYEDLALDPEKMSSWLLKRLVLPKTPSVREFIVTHTTGDSVFVDTKRTLGSRISTWQKLPWTLTNATQMACAGVLEKYGYISLPSYESLSQAETINASYTFGDVL